MRQTAEVTMYYQGRTRGGALVLVEDETDEDAQTVFVPESCVTNLDELGRLEIGKAYDFEIFENIAVEKGLV